MNLSTISELVHRSGEKAHAIGTGKEAADVRQLADALADLAEAQLRLIGTTGATTAG